MSRWARLVAGALALVARTANAESVTGGGDLQRFTAAPTPYAGFAAGGGELLAPGDYVLGLEGNYARNPLLLELDGARSVATIRDNLTFDLHAGVGILEWLDLSVLLPIVPWQDGVDPRVTSFQGQAVGDLRLAPRVRLLSQERSGIGLSFTPAFAVPLGGGVALAGERNGAFLPSLDFSYYGKRGFVAGGASFTLRGAASPLAKVQLGNELGAKLSAGGYLSERATLIGELSGGVAFATSAQGKLGNPLEALGGVRYFAQDHWAIDVAAGGGLLSAPGTPDLRVVFGFTYVSRPQPQAVPTCVRFNIDGTSTRVPLSGHDTDGDGIDDACDLCPNDAAPGALGCPTKPAAAPPALACPAPPPPPMCPAAPPEKLCPVAVLLPPPSKAVAVEVKNVVKKLDRIITTKAIGFAFDKATIDPASLPLVEAVEYAIAKLPPTDLIRVEGHTDDKGTHEYNVDLSNRRAQAVMAELVRLGVDAQRLSAKGWGEARPLADNKTERSRAKNRRVEFVFYSPGETPPTDLAPAKTEKK